MLLENGAVGLGAIRTSPVSVMDQPRSGASMRDRIAQSTNSELLGQTGPHGLSHDLAGAWVLDGGKVEPPLGRGDVGEIHMPDGI